MLFVTALCLQQGDTRRLTSTEVGEKPTVVLLNDGRAGLWDCRCSTRGECRRPSLLWHM
jgi:hypothetical protein